VVRGAQHGNEECQFHNPRRQSDFDTRRPMGGTTGEVKWRCRKCRLYDVSMVHATLYTLHGRNKGKTSGDAQEDQTGSKQAIIRRTRPVEEASASHYCNSIYFSRGNTFARRQREMFEKSHFLMRLGCGGSDGPFSSVRRVKLRAGESQRNSFDTSQSALVVRRPFGWDRCGCERSASTQAMPVATAEPFPSKVVLLANKTWSFGSLWRTRHRD